MSLRNAGFKATVAALTSVTADTATTTLLAANSNRVGATILNDSTATLYLRLSTTGDASATNRSVDIGPSDYYELPYGYTGRVEGIWSAVNGAARITEFS